MRPDRAIVGKPANIPPMPERGDIAIRFETGEFAVRKALATLMGRLALLRLAPDTLGQVEIVVAEVLNNIVEHGYDDAGEIALGVSVLPERLRFTTVDEGGALPQHLLNSGAMPDIPADPLDIPEGGFGWALIRELTDDLTYRRLDGRNHLTFSILRAEPLQ